MITNSIIYTNYICEICGRSDRRLIRHHISYEPEKTMYVCREECHAKAEQIQDCPIKSILINDNVHKLIVDKRYELQKAGIRIGLSELARKVIMTCADKYVDKLLHENKFKELVLI